MGDHDQIIDVLGGNEIAELAGETASGAAGPHVLGEIAIDDDVVARIGEALDHRLDHRWLPVVVIRVGLFAGAMHEGDPRVGQTAVANDEQGECHKRSDHDDLPTPRAAGRRRTPAAGFARRGLRAAADGRPGRWIGIAAHRPRGDSRLRRGRFLLPEATATAPQTTRAAIKNQTIV
jgi:hypothetical protein